MNMTLVHIRKLIQHVAISVWERGFLKSVLKQKFAYTETQLEILERMWKTYYPEPIDDLEFELITEFMNKIWKSRLAHEIMLIKLGPNELPF